MADLQRYDELREAQRKANTALLKALPDGAKGRAMIFAGARALKYKVIDDTIAFPDDSATDRLYEFLLYEPRANGSVWAESVLESENELLPLEREVVRATVDGRVSLYEIRRVNRPESTILVQDLLDEGPDIEIVDRGLSRTASPDGIVFGRVVTVGELYFFSGASVTFGRGEKTLLLSQLAKLNKVRNDTLFRRKRFALFMELEKYSSIRTLYEL